MKGHARVNLHKRHTAWLSILCMLFLFAVAQAEELPRGIVIEKVVCQTDAAQSYALYLPQGYTPQKSWPIIYAFDPLARATVPVKLFQEAAEKYGYIIAASHNTQNGMQGAALQAAISALLKDTRKRLSLDEKRIYTAGFSGGARIATRVASSCGGCIAGVIACGAGFPSDITPTADTRFAFYGTIGIEDYNYPELKRLDDKLNALALPHRIVSFDGAHQWANSTLLIEAVEWLEVQAMRAGRRAKDEALLETVWQKSLARARADAESNRLLEAYQDYAALAADFSQLKDVAEHEKKAASLKETKEVRQALKVERAQIEKQLEIAARLINLGGRLLTQAQERASVIREVQNVLEGLRKQAAEDIDSGERRIARRALRQVFAQTVEAAMFHYHPNRQYDVALVNLEMASLIAPDNWLPPYQMARAYALLGQKKNSLAALQRAVAKGFQNHATIQDEKDFDSLRAEAEYQSIIKSLTEQRQEKR